MTCQIANVISSILAGMAAEAQGAAPTGVPETPVLAQAEERRETAKPRLRRVSLGGGRYVDLDETRESRRPAH
ncbi:MAG: hypothetical protein JNM82_07120 [Rhodocyclaceae bacterium]|nr:hypothetical protein [Rhodocyclaceae bacterium]